VFSARVGTLTVALCHSSPPLFTGKIYKNANFFAKATKKLQKSPVLRRFGDYSP
jgi:hypothetical protein